MKKLSSFKNFEIKELSMRKIEGSKRGSFKVPVGLVSSAIVALGGVISWKIFG